MTSRIALLSAGLATALAGTLAALPDDPRGLGRADGHGDQRLPDERPRPGLRRAGQDLLLALPAGRGDREAQGADAPAQPRLGRLAHEGRGVVQAVPRRRLRRAVLRPARVRRERRPRAGQNADFEGHDVRALVKLVSKLPWVKKDRPGDPRLGAIGGSYGGGYQFLGAFEEIRVQGRQVFDALAPQITWYDLSQSLAPEGVVRTEWALALSAAGVPTDALPPKIYKALVEGAATGTWPDGSIPGTENLKEFFRKNGPRWHVRQGRRITVPVLFGQGMTDTLFASEQGLSNWRLSLGKKARKRSIYVGYNGGHVLPSVYPQGVNVTSDPCSQKLAGGNFEALTLRFFDEQLKGKKTGLKGYDHLHFATRGSGCVTVHNAQPDKTFPLGTIVAQTGPAGPALATEVAKGPITHRRVVVPHRRRHLARRSTTGRSSGSPWAPSPLDATLVQNNVLPLREATPVTGVKRRITVPSVSVEVPAGQSLYLLVSPTSETFVGDGQPPAGPVHPRKRGAAPPRRLTRHDLPS